MIFSVLIFLLDIPQGVPIRVEIGPKDVEKRQFVAVRRDTGAKVWEVNQLQSFVFNQPR